VTGSRRFSQAVSEGDGISIVAAVDGLDSARRAEADGAEAVLVGSGREGGLDEIRDGISLPILFYWDGQDADRFRGADACVLDASGDDQVEHAHTELGEDFEVALRVEDEDQLARTLERFDPELFVLGTADEEEALDRVLELLPDVPAGKLAIADLPATTRDQVLELERAGVDAVIVRAGNVAELVGGAPPEV
jgi:hypothetical protein